MTMWMQKINWSNQQCRITIPRGLVSRYGLNYTSYVALDDSEKDGIKIRRFVFHDEKNVISKIAGDGQDR